MDRSLGEYIRKAAFMALDALKGHPVMKHYHDVAFLLSHPEQVKVRQDEQFQKLAQFAVKNTEFYKFVGMRTQYCLKDFPTIDKTIIKNNHKALCSHLAYKKNVVRMHTSGSTGTPLEVIQDKNKRNRVYAEMMYLWGISGYEIGMRYMFLRKWNKLNKKSKLTATARNLLMTDVSSLDDETLEKIRQTLLKDNKIRMIIGYASTLDYLAQYLEKKGNQPSEFSVRTILSSSEVLTEKTRCALKRVFGCNVVSLYSNQENGMLAVECNENKEFHLNTASYIFEILKIDSDEPAEYGELGRVVVTDLYNLAMPMIRYDTGDLAIKKKDVECDLHTEAISSVQGRKVDIVYDTKGVPLSPHTITNTFWKFDKLKQFQIIQEDEKVYRVVVNDPCQCYKQEEIRDVCKSIFGNDAVLNIEESDDIPVLASGKFKYLINRWDRKG